MQISVSPGGVPKRAVPSARVTTLGLALIGVSPAMRAGLVARVGQQRALGVKAESLDHQDLRRLGGTSGTLVSSHLGVGE